MLAALIGFLGEVEVAEEAAQEAFAIATERWPQDGAPTNPSAWLVTTARNRAINRIRRNRTLAAKTRLLQVPQAVEDMMDATAFPYERLEHQPPAPLAANPVAGPVTLAGAMTVDPLLDRIDAYCDTVPRPAARAEAHGPLTLFVNDGPGWPYYARPTRGTATVTPSDVDRVRARQRQLGIPEAFEWIAEVTSSLAPAASAAGLVVTDHPLLVLEPGGLRPIPRPEGVELRLVGPDDDLAAITAVAQVGFAHPGTATGPVGAEALSRAAARRDPEGLGFERARLASGLTVMAVALLDGQPVAVGSHQPVGPVTEVVGVATLPTWRRRGLGAAVTAFLVQDAGRRGAEVVFLSAGDDAVARVYKRLGFRRVGVHGAAEPPQPAGH